MQSKRVIQIFLSAVLFGLMASRAAAQNGVASADGTAQKLDIYVSESKIVYLSKPVDDVSSSNTDVLTVEKVRGMDTQIAITGAAVGDATVTVKTSDGTRTYLIKVSPMPQRVYINIPESKYLSFKNRVDDFNLSVAGVVRVLQPTDRELLIEALPLAAAGTRTTLTVYSKGEILRYYVSTFTNRGADVLEIQNAFTSRGYKYLTVKFDNDQATIGGTVTTQEELDDATRIVKQYTPYVVVKAMIGAYGELSNETEQEHIIAANILRISQVKGLIVKVKFEEPRENTSSTFTRVVGQPALTTSVTDNQTRLTTTTTDLPKDTTTPISHVPNEGSIETVHVDQDKSLPEKIFLFGELEDDLQEARAIRVARTFCPFVVSMVTVKDPIQVRVKTHILTVDINKLKNTGVNWYSGTDTTSFPLAGGGLTYNYMHKVPDIHDLTLGLQADVQFTLNLGENNNFIHEIQEIDLMLANGQPSQIFRGESIPYPSSRTVDVAGNIITSAAFIDVGLQVFILPLNWERASQRAGEFQNLTENGTFLVPNSSKYYQLSSTIGHQGAPPVIDESLKYVDENGMIGMNVFVDVSALEEFVPIGPDVTAPRTSQKRSTARAQLREGQSAVIGGILDDSLQKTIKSVPGFNKIPIFGFLFDSNNKTGSTAEMLLVFTPEIVRSPDIARRLPKPHLPEMSDLMQQEKILPVGLKPVRYDARGVDLRSDLLSAPHAAVDAKAIQPPAEPAATLTPIPVVPPTTEAPAPVTPATPDVSKLPVTDTADVNPPTPAPAPSAQPNVDTASPRVNNPSNNSNEPPSTLP